MYTHSNITTIDQNEKLNRRKSIHIAVYVSVSIAQVRLHAHFTFPYTAVIFIPILGFNYVLASQTLAPKVHLLFYQQPFCSALTLLPDLVTETFGENVLRHEVCAHHLKQTILWMMVGTYSAVCGIEKVQFLTVCCQKLSPAVIRRVCTAQSRALWQCELVAFHLLLSATSPKARLCDGVGLYRYTSVMAALLQKGWLGCAAFTPHLFQGRPCIYRNSKFSLELRSVQQLCDELDPEISGFGVGPQEWACVTVAAANFYHLVQRLEWKEWRLL